MGPKKAINNTNVVVETSTTNNTTNNTTNPTNGSEPIKAKRGRKSKKYLMESLNMTFTKDTEKTQTISLNVNEIEEQSTELECNNNSTVYDNVLNDELFLDAPTNNNHVVIIENPNKTIISVI